MSCYILWSFIALILFICTLSIIFNYETNIKLLDKECTITKVTYPSVLPNLINSSYDNFIKCDCGRYCTSELGICINIYAYIDNINNTKKVFEKTSTLDSLCTFTETICKDGESINNRILKINEATNTGEYYSSFINNTNINCYVDKKNNIYLQKHVDYTLIIVLSSILFFIIIMLVYCYYTQKNNHISYMV